MKSTIYFLFFLSPLLSFASNGEVTVSNQDFIRKEISNISEVADFKYSEIKDMFIEAPQYSVSCYLDETQMNYDDKVFFLNRMNPDLKYITQIEVAKEDNLAFDLVVNTQPVNMDKDIDENIYSSLVCEMSKLGCSYLSLITDKDVMLPMYEDEPKVETVNMKIAWTYYIKEKSSIFSEMSLSAKVPQYNFLGRNNGYGYYNAKYLCDLKLNSEKVEL